jgi:dTDP-3-amino-3,4,6-trideoxy-alpha-D-glucose transaminase
VNATHTVPAAGELAVPFVRLDRDDPELLEDLLEEVRSVAADSAFILGRHVDAFEADFADYCESEHAVGVGSGTDALLLALRAVGVGPGDEVIVPANTFIATAEAVSLAGAVPRLVDPDSETGLLTAELVQAALTPRVRCIVPVHLYGATVDMDPILDLARAAGIPVIEDACQAHGARYKGRRVGSIGAAGCFSFYPAKNLGAWGDGGAVVTNDEALADTVRLLRSHGERPRYHHRVVGTTSRLDGLQAAVLRVKLRRLDGWNDDRRQAADALRRALHGANVDLPLLAVAEGDHVYHLFAIRCDDRDGLREHLASRGIAAAVHYPVPIHRTEAYADLGLGRGSMPVAERAAERVLSLPLFPGMTGEEIAAVAAAVHDWQ